MTPPRAGALACVALTAGCVADVELTRAPGSIAASAGRWTAVESGTTRDLHRVRGSGAGDVWAVGGADLAAGWDSDAGERWAVGARGTVLRFGR